MKDDLIQVYFKNKHGICPACNTRMVFVAYTTQLFSLTEPGMVEKEILYDDCRYNFCPKCNFMLPVEKTVDGVKPIPYIHKSDINKINPIGIVEEGVTNG